MNLESATSNSSGVATYAFWAFVSGSSSVRGISCLDVNILVDVPMLRTAEEAKLRLPLMRYPLSQGYLLIPVLDLGAKVLEVLDIAGDDRRAVLEGMSGDEDVRIVMGAAP